MAAETPDLAFTTDNTLVFILDTCFETPRHYRPLITGLKQQGYHVYSINFPSSVPPGSSSKQSAYDIDLFHQILKRAVKRNSYVIVISHAYGSLVALNAMSVRLEVTERRRSGRLGGISHYIYLRALQSIKPEADENVIGLVVDASINVAPYCTESLTYQELAEQTDPERWAERLNVASHCILAGNQTIGNHEKLLASYEFQASCQTIEEELAIAAKMDDDSPRWVYAGSTNPDLSLWRNPFLGIPDSFMSAIQKVVLPLVPKRPERPDERIPAESAPYDVPEYSPSKFHHCLVY